VTPVFKTTCIRPGTYHVQAGDRYETVYVTGPQRDRWAYWNGQVFRIKKGAADAPAGRTRRSGGSQSLAAPMPATVVKVLVSPGAPVRGGDTLVVLEAMKMELPIRATGNGTVKAVYCREGELVQPDHVLVEMI